MEETKTCLGCGTTFGRPRGISDVQWKTRRYCTRPCYMRSDRPARREVSYEAKTCQMCGKVFERPPNQRGRIWASRVYCSHACVVRARSVKAWEKRPVRVCPICGSEFRSRYPQAATCGGEECKRRNRREIAAGKIADRMRAAYAAGERPKIRGISPREEILWPLLVDHGWTWQLRWFDAWGCFEIDFSLPERQLAVEIDGKEHRQSKRRARDEARDAELARRGWTVVRIANAEVDADSKGVSERILAL